MTRLSLGFPCGSIRLLNPRQAPIAPLRPFPVLCRSHYLMRVTHPQSVCWGTWGRCRRVGPVQAEQIEQLVSRITRQLESLGETEIPSSTVGDFIMKALKSVDEVAYVRYASVYKDFRHTGDFARFLGDEGLDES